VNAQPSRAWDARAIAPTRKSAASTEVASVAFVPRSAWVQTRKTTASAAAAAPSLTDTRLARARISPVVFRARNTAPWKVNSDSVTRPASSAYGLSRSRKEPT